MKTLKLDHVFAEQVRAGKKSVTRRMYDDKDLHVNDKLELVDKIDPKRTESWKVFAHACVDKVIEVRLAELNSEEGSEGEEFGSQEELLKKFRDYYGPQVTLDTPVKIVYFSLNNQAPREIESALPKLKEAKMYADGGSRGNPGPSASGFVIFNMEDQIVVKEGVYLGVTTNNQAEYQALRLGLEEARRMGVQTIHVYMDSLLVVNQMKGIFKVKNRDLWPIHEAIKRVAVSFKQVTFTHVPRALNKIADSAVNEALDEAATRQ